MEDIHKEIEKRLEKLTRIGQAKEAGITERLKAFVSGHFGRLSEAKSK